MEKIISKNVLKGAVVLLIAVAMIFSTATVIADTKEENCSSASSKMSETYENHPQVQNTIMKYNSNNLGNLFSQFPLGPNDPDKDARTSDVSMGYKVYENFWGITEPICDIHWWGFAMRWSPGWDIGTPAGMTFDITFYTDIGGQPGNVVCYYPGITYSATSTGIMYDWGINWELYIFEANLNPCCSISNGWVSIESTFSPNNYVFLWMNSKDGNLQSLQNSMTLSFDFSFILTGNDPPTTPLINGPATGKAGTSYTYTFTSTDPNGDQVQYYIDWDDGTPPTWSVLQTSDTPYSSSHIWTTQGSYVIKAKTRDTKNAESILTTYSVTMPRNKPYLNTPFLQFLENLIQRFPLLARLIQLPIFERL